MTRVNNKSKYLDYYLNDKEYYLNDKGKVESLGDKDRNSKSRFLSRLRKKDKLQQFTDTNTNTSTNRE